MVKKRQRKKNAKKRNSQTGGGGISTRSLNEFKRLRGNMLAKLNRIERKIGEDARRDAESQLNLNLEKTATHYTDPSEMKNAIDEMRHFTNRYNTRFQYHKNVYGVWWNQRELNEKERKNKANIRRAEKELKKVQDITKQNEELYMREMLLGTEKIAGVTIPSELDVHKIRYQSTLRDRFRSIDFRSKPTYYDERKQRMMDNYITILNLSFNNDAKKLIKELQKLTPDEFYNLYVNNLIEMDFEYFDSDGMQDDFGKIAEITSYLKRYQRGEVQLDLKEI